MKSKVSLWYQICSLGTKPNIPSQIYWTKFTTPNLKNWIYKIKSTNQNVFNAKNQIYQTKPIQSNLQNKINPIINIKPNLYKPNLQTVKVKSNSSLSWAWPSSAPACYIIWWVAQVKLSPTRSLKFDIWSWLFETWISKYVIWNFTFGIWHFKSKQEVTLS